VGRTLDEIAAAVADAEGFLRDIQWRWGMHGRLPKQVGRRRGWNDRRDADICFLIRLLGEKYGLSPTRSKNRHGTTDNVSASWVIARALGNLKLTNIDERAVEKIWQKREERRAKQDARPNNTTPEAIRDFDKIVERLNRVDVRKVVRYLFRERRLETWLGPG
jgi:hypothetical protein